MILNIYKQLSIYQKFGSLLTVILLILSGLIYFNQQRQIIESNTARMESHLQDIHNLFDLQLKEKQEQVNSSLAVARHALTSKGALYEVDSLQQDILAVNQISKQGHQVRLKMLFAGSTPLYNNFEVVDQIQQLTGQTATIFQKIDGGYLRISTNVRKQDGERAVGTFIPNDSEVVKSVESGNTYRGRAFVVSAWYVTAYEPIYINGKVRGMLYVGVQEKDLNFLKEKFHEKLFYETGYPYALTSEGEFLIHKTKEGKKLEGDAFVQQLLEQKEGKITLPWGGKDGESMIHFLKYHDYYGITLGIAVPEDEMISQPLAQLKIIIVGGFFISLFLMLLVVHTIVTPLRKVNQNLKLLAQRKRVTVEMTDRKDEVGELNRSLNQVVKGMDEASVFATEIGKGNFEANFNAIGEEDSLGNSLLQMRNELKKVSVEEGIRQWFNEGVAQFSDIARRHNSDLDELCQQTTGQLVKYLNANQGALYILEEDKNTKTSYLELKSCYAYGKKKHLIRRMDLGEGMIGQVALEKDYRYLTEIPQDYVRITSGLGETTAKSLIMVPLINNDEVQGVIELASFNPIAKHEIEFLQKVAENIASWIASVKVNEVTKLLLQDAQQMTEEIRAQEEELRQNTEELLATQEEMNRKMREMENENMRLHDQLSHIKEKATVSVNSAIQ